MSNAKKIMELAEKYRDYTAKNLGKMVKIPSESMKEKDVQAEVARQMKEAGFDEVRTEVVAQCPRFGAGFRYEPNP